MTDGGDKARCYNCGKSRMFVTVKSQTFCCECAYYIEKAIFLQGNEDWIHFDKKLDKESDRVKLKKPKPARKRIEGLTLKSKELL